MKKIFTLLGAALVAVSAISAQAQNYQELYLRGNQFGWNTKSTDNQLTTEDGNVYTISLDVLQSGFKIAAFSGDSGWDNNYNFGSASGIEPGKTYTLVNGGSSSDITTKSGADIENVKLTLTISTLELKVEGTLGQATYPDNLYLVGLFNNWNEKDDSYKLTNEGNGKYTIKNVNIAAGQSLKISNGTWANSWGPFQKDEPLPIGTSFKLALNYNDTNFSLPSGLTDATFEFTYDLDDLENCTLLVTSEGDDVPVTTVPSSVYLKGDINSWNGTEMPIKSSTANSDGYYEYTATFPTLSGQFKIAEHPGDDWTGVNFGAGDQRSPIIGETIDSYYNGWDFICSEDFTNITLTFYYNPNTNSAKLGASGEVVYPETLYIIGNVAPGFAFNPTEGTLMTAKGEGVFEINNIEIKNDDSDYAYFGFATQLLETEDWDAFDAYRYGPAENNTVVTTDNSYGVVKVGYNSYQIAPGSYKITVDLSTMKMSVAEPTVGVESIEAAENGNVKFYNFQGVEVSNPAPGMYIKVVDNKATKVIVK